MASCRRYLILGVEIAEEEPMPDVRLGEVCDLSMRAKVLGVSAAYDYEGAVELWRDMYGEEVADGDD